MEDNKTESGFSFDNLILLESTFHRINNIAFDDKAQHSFNIHVGVATTKEGIIVSEDVTVKQVREDVEQYCITAKMVGIFARQGKSELKNDEEFGRVNGAAIIFPFVREHIAGIALKGGLGTVLIPPVNFTKYVDAPDGEVSE